MATAALIIALVALVIALIQLTILRPVEHKLQRTLDAGLRKDLGAAEQLLQRLIQAHNNTTTTSMDLRDRLDYHEKTVVALQRSRVKLDKRREQEQRAAEAQAKLAAPPQPEAPAAAAPPSETTSAPVVYGPHECERCGQPIYKVAREQGGAEYDAPADGKPDPADVTTYPPHQCAGVGAPQADAAVTAAAEHG